MDFCDPPRNGGNKPNSSLLPATLCIHLRESRFVGDRQLVSLQSFGASIVMADSCELQCWIRSHVTNVVVKHRTQHGEHGCYGLFRASHLAGRATQTVSAPLWTAVLVLFDV